MSMDVTNLQVLNLLLLLLLLLLSYNRAYCDYVIPDFVNL
jgi:hypothetical protein